jgi:hypothetical protein
MSLFELFKCLQVAVEAAGGVDRAVEVAVEGDDRALEVKGVRQFSVVPDVVLKVGRVEMREEDMPSAD